MNGVTQCPKRHAIGDGDWLYAYGGDVEENNIDDEENDNIIQMVNIRTRYFIL